MHQETLVASEEEAGQKIAELGEGWYGIPCSDHERGCYGTIVYRRGVPEDEEDSRWYLWTRYGRVLTPEIKVVEPGEAWAWVQGETGWLQPSDDAKRLLWGFVSYRRHQEGMSEVRRCRMTSLKADREAYERLNALRISLSAQARG